MTIVAQLSGVGSIPLLRAPSPVASSTAANAAFQASQSYASSFVPQAKVVSRPRQRSIRSLNLSVTNEARVRKDLRALG
jgi:hypothetical protein